MYERFYGVNVPPFVLTPDPAFLVMTEAHCNAKAGLMYAILAGKGFTVLTGDAGTGKTTILRSAINAISERNPCFSLIFNPDLAPEEFLEMALRDFGLPEEGTKPERLRKLHEYLLRVHEDGSTAIIFVDEAHRLRPETLEEIRLLTNFETDTKKLLQIVLVGQDELDELLDRRELRQLKQRVEVRLRIGNLSPEEIPVYVARRWNSAGGFRHPFSDGAMQLIRTHSGGVPRLINILCDNALLVGFAKAAAVVTEEHVLEASRDLHLTGAPGTRGGASAPRRSNANLDLQVPPPAAHYHGNGPLSLFSHVKPRRAWWRSSVKSEKSA